MKLPVLKKFEDFGGHVFATCWVTQDSILQTKLLQNFDKNKVIRFMKSTNWKKEKSFVCVKCRMEIEPLSVIDRDNRVPDSQPLDTCDEYRTRTLLDA